MIRGEHCIRCMLCSSRNVSEVLPKIHTLENFDFFKSIIHTQILSVLSCLALCAIFIHFIPSCVLRAGLVIRHAQHS